VGCSGREGYRGTGRLAKASDDDGFKSTFLKLRYEQLNPLQVSQLNRLRSFSDALWHFQSARFFK